MLFIGIVVWLAIFIYEGVALKISICFLCARVKIDEIRGRLKRNIIAAFVRHSFSFFLFLRHSQSVSTVLCSPSKRKDWVERKGTTKKRRWINFVFSFVACESVKWNLPRQRVCSLFCFSSFTRAQIVFVALVLVSSVDVPFPQDNSIYHVRIWLVNLFNF